MADKYGPSNDRRPEPDLMSVLQLPDPWAVCANCASTLEPSARNLTRIQLEWSSLMGHRARAYMNLPQAIMQCRTPADIMRAQMAFWQEAGRDYADGGRHMLDAWHAMLAPPAAVPSGDVVMPRNDITFHDAKADALSEGQRRPGDSRRAA